MAEILIFGASRQGRVVLEVLRAAAEHRVIGFLDDDPARHGALEDGAPVLGGMAWAAENAGRGAGAIVAIGSNNARAAIGRQLRELGFGLINAIHPSAVVQNHVSMGSGNLVCAGAILVTGTQLEDDVVINTAASIDHDSLLCSGSQVASGVTTAGCVTIGAGAFVGSGAILGPSVTIGERAIVGAGSLVLADVPAGVVAYGVPCRVIRAVTAPVDWGAIMGGSPSLRTRRRGR